MPLRPPSSPSSRPRPLAWLLCLGLWSATGMLPGQNKPTPEVQRILEQIRINGIEIQGDVRININGQALVLKDNTVEVGPFNGFPQGSSTLRWRNGEILMGTLAGVKDGTLLWQSPVFTAPLELDMAALKSADLAAPASRTEEAFCARLRDGGRLFGTPVSIEGDVLKFRSVRHGEVSLRMGEIVSLQRTRGPGLLYNGPDTAEGWRPSTGTTAKAEWRTLDSGAFGTHFWNRGTRIDLDLPEKLDVLLRVSAATASPEFTFTLGATSGPQLSLENWSGTLVLTQGSRFVPLGDVTGKSTVAVRLLWDRAADRALAFTPDGQPLGELQPKAKSADPATPPVTTVVSKGVQLRNNGIDLILDELRVREWSGQMPGRMSSTEPHVELTNGKVLMGKPAQISSGRLLLASGEAVPLEMVESVFTGAAPAPASAPPVIVAFGDGTRIVGTLQSVMDGTLALQSSASSAPITAPLSGVQRIHFAVPPAPGTPPEPSFDKQDTLAAGKVTLHGRVLGAGSDQPRWLPVGGRVPVEMAPGPKPVFSRVFSPEDHSTSGALVYLEDGDILPAEVRAMDATSLHVSSAISAVKEMPATQVQAVQFAGRKLELKGFSDPGWRQIRGGAGSLERDASKVIFRQSASLAHPNILQGDEVKFSLTPEDGWGALRVRVFTSGGDEPQGGIPFLLWVSGNELYGGQESDRGGEIFNQTQIRVTPNQPVIIRIALREKEIELLANGVSISKAAAVPGVATAQGGKVQLQGGNIRVRGGGVVIFNNFRGGGGGDQPSPPRMLGPGLVLETASLWGNGEQPVGLRDFSVRPNPMRPWMPAVDPDAREQILTLPRFRTDDPPTHVLVALNGDVLRGRLEAATAEHLRIISGMEPLTVPRDRVAAVIRLHPPDKTVSPSAPEKPAPPTIDVPNPEPALPRAPVDPFAPAPPALFGGADPKPAPAPVADPPPPKPAAPKVPPFATHWLLLTNGGRLGLKVERFDADKIIGTSTLLGRCEVPWNLVHTLRYDAPDPTTAQASYRDWKLFPAPEPVLPEGGSQNAPLLGAEVKNFKLPLLAGGEFDYAKHRGKIVILDFWATWCGPCIQSMPQLMDTVASLRSDEAIADKFVFLAVNQAEPQVQVKRFLDTRGWNLPVALDLLQSVGRQFQVEGIPNTVVIGPDGKVVWQEVGFRPGATKELAELVKKLATTQPQ